MSENKNNTDRNEIRNTLLANGYTPLPLAQKGCYVKGWSRVEVTEEWLKQYARQARYPNTGLRCDKLLAFDIDVLNEALADDVEQRIEACVGRTDLCRVGQWPKRLLLYRVKGKPGKTARTGRYGNHMVELLCSHGRQFAGFGRHPSGVDYEWCDDTSPLGVPFKKLPAVDYEAAEHALAECDKLLKATGLPLMRKAHAQGLHADQEFDLTDGFEIKLNNGELVTWGELKPDLTKEGVFGNIKREDGEFGDSDAVHFYIATGSGEPCAHDFVHDCTHWEQPITPELADVLPDAENNIGETDLFTDDALADLVENWVLLKDGTVRHIEHPQRLFDLPKFHSAMQHLTVPAPTARNPAATEPATKAWAKDFRAMRADYAALRPDHPTDAFVDDEGLTAFNTYNPVVHEQRGGEHETFLEFIEHLVPEHEETELYLDWLSLKIQRPGWRMHGMMMVTPEYGTGRGTLTQIMQKLMGLQYVREIPLSQLIGQGGQAQFNDYMADCLMVCVPEALEENEDQHRWMARHAAYEQLKLVCDPISQQIHVRRKFGRNSTEWCYASIFISSNHVDALAIEQGDRRLIVLDNTETPLYDAPRDLGVRIHEWAKRPNNIGGLYHWLATRVDVDDLVKQYDPFGPPPSTPAKERMIASSQSDTDRAYDYMLDNAKGDVVTPHQWRAWIMKARMDLGLDLPIGDKLHAAATAVISKRARRTGLGDKLIKIDGKPFRVWAIRNFAAWKSPDVSNYQLAAECKKNGAPGGDVVEFPGPKNG